MCGSKAGFFMKFTRGGSRRCVAGVGIADQAGGEFDGAPTMRYAILFDEDDFARIGERQDDRGADIIDARRI